MDAQTSQRNSLPLFSMVCFGVHFKCYETKSRLKSRQPEMLLVNGNELISPSYKRKQTISVCDLFSLSMRKYSII